MAHITVTFRHANDTCAQIMRSDYGDWRPAAARAVRRRYGRGASVSWQSAGWEQDDRTRRVVRAHYTGTIEEGGQVLDTASVSI